MSDRTGDTRPVIKNHVSRVMGEQRLNIQDVARRASIDYGIVFRLYHDRAKRVDLETLDKLCGALGVGVGDLFEYLPASQTA
jgi:putative transcriptional regulator